MDEMDFDANDEQFCEYDEAAAEPCGVFFVLIIRKTTTASTTAAGPGAAATDRTPVHEYQEPEVQRAR